jgi:hypothetical protein
MEPIDKIALEQNGAWSIFEAAAFANGGGF